MYELKAVSKNIGTTTPKQTRVVSILISPDQNGDNINVASVDTTPLGSYEEEKWNIYVQIISICNNIL